MDRRQQKTRNAIFNAFKNLLSKYKYSNITVQKIIDEADVGRSTFYAHFETKDALLKEMCIDLFEHVVNNHSKSEITHDFSKTQENTYTFITHILYHLRDDEKNIIGILKGESGDLFLRYFKEYLKDIFAKQMDNRLKNSYIPQDFLLNHITCSFVEMVNWWIKNNMKQSPEELEHYFCAVVDPIL